MASLRERSNTMPDTEVRIEMSEKSQASTPTLPKKLSGRSSGKGFLRTLTSAWEKDNDIDKEAYKHGSRSKWVTFAILTMQSVGIVYGDIGTSFIYVFPSVFSKQPSEEDVIGAVSLVIWTITSLVLVKYALIVLRADDNGQGGTFALYSLLKRQAEMGESSKSLDKSLAQYSMSAKQMSQRNSFGRKMSHVAQGKREARRQRFIESHITQNVIRVLVVAGVGFILGDGVLTPAVSIVSACEGINVRWPSVSRGVVDGIAIAIVVLLFGVQQFGTGFVGSLFSPIITLWLSSNAVIGVYNIAKYYPAIFKAISPSFWFKYFLRNGHAGWYSLGGVLLCVTGTEALFADMGHFSRQSIQTSFIGLAWPCLILTYLGQAAYLVKHPQVYGTSFWDSLPHGTFYPMWILATFASVIASQALISAVFQIVKQAIAQGFFPRFTVKHTSEKHEGQIYIPFMNYLLGLLCIILIATFKTSLQLTKAYGLAVICDMLLTTTFSTLVIFCVWKKPLIFPLAFFLVFFTIEATFLSATAEKVPTGGWFSLMMSGIYTFIMLLWFHGSHHKISYFHKHAMNLSRLLQVREDPKASDGQPRRILVMGEKPVSRLRGIALYYSDMLYGAPPVLENHVLRFPALHDVNIVLTNRTVPVPHVGQYERFLVKQLHIPGFFHVIARYGYSERIIQDEEFVDVVLQRISILLYQTLSEKLAAEPALLRHVSASIPEMPRSVFGGDVTPIMEDAEHTDHPGSVTTMPALKSLPMEAQEQFRSYLSGSVVRRSAPAGSSAPMQRQSSGLIQPRGSQHGFTDESFAAIVNAGSTGEIMDAKTAAAMSAWAARVASGQEQITQDQSDLRGLARELAGIAAAKEHGIVYVVGHAQARSNEGKNLLKKYLVEEPYLFMVKNFTSHADLAFGIPEDKVLIVGLPYPL